MTTSTQKGTPQSKGASSAQFQGMLDSAATMLKEDYPAWYGIITDLPYWVLGIWSVESTLGNNLRQNDVVFNGYNLRSNRSSTYYSIYTGNPAVLNMRQAAGDPNTAIDIGITRSHGIGQVIGAEHIRNGGGSVMNVKDTFIQAAIAKYGLEYKPTQVPSPIVTAIYNTAFGGFTGMQRGMAMSIATLYAKWLRTRNIQTAVSSYLGTGVDVITHLSTNDYLTKVSSARNSYINGGGNVPANTPNAASGTQVATIATKSIGCA